MAQWEMDNMEQSLQVMAKRERLENWTAKIAACRGKRHDSPEVVLGEWSIGVDILLAAAVV